MTETLTDAARAWLSELGRRGGKARAAKLSKKRKREIARKAGSAPKRKRSDAKSDESDA